LAGKKALEQWSDSKLACFGKPYNVTSGAPPRVFIMVRSLSTKAIKTGEWRFAESVAKLWQPFERNDGYRKATSHNRCAQP